MAFLGRNSKILNDAQEPVHIIIDRVTSKTKDAYVEFITMQDAMRAVQRHQSTIDRGRTARLGDRPVAVELSSQDALMADLFPHARVQWVQGVPVIDQTKEDRFPWRSFAGFVTEEEMAMLVKHVEQPHRVSRISHWVNEFLNHQMSIVLILATRLPSARTARSARTNAWCPPSQSCRGILASKSP